MRACSLEGCFNEHHSLGLCHHHRRAFRKGRLPGYVPQRTVHASPTHCTVEGCDGKFYAKGRCERHYRQLNGSRAVAVEWPFAVRKIDGVWHRRPSDCDPGTPWEIVPGFVGVSV
jgi:hypothetical protein